MREPAGAGRIEDVPEHHPVIERRMIHQGRVWDVAWERFDYDGTPIVRELVDHPGAVAVLIVSFGAGIVMSGVKDGHRAP